MRISDWSSDVCSSDLGAQAAGGRVVGIIPQHLEALEAGNRTASEYLVVNSMHARKQLMAERSDAFCALPGGLGTLDETFEIITWRQLKLHDKPVILVNLDGYWDPLLRLVEHQTAAGRSEEHTSELQSLMRIS